MRRHRLDHLTMLGSLGLAIFAPSHAAAAQKPRPPDSYCASNDVKTTSFDQPLSSDWVVSERPMKSARAPYPDGSIDGDTRANVQVRDGALHLISQRAGDGFTGSRILSRRPIRYGCVEFVARLPRGRGFWPALWLRTPYDGSPMNGEIDMVEGYGSHPGVFVSTLHHWRAGIDADSAHRRYVDGVDRTYTCAKVVADAPQSIVATQLALAAAKFSGTPRRDLSNWLFANYSNACTIHAVTKASDFSQGYHRYLVVWTPDRVIWALDGERFFETTDGIPHGAMMIVLGLSVGAMDGGPDAGTPAMGDLQVKSVRIAALRQN